MTGGLMNLVAYGNENLFIDESKKNIFLKRHIININFGLQYFSRF